MRALIAADYGATPEIADVPRPVPGPDEVLVKVAASSVNGFDGMVVGGYLKGMLPHTFPAVLGKDFAGTVEAVGTGVHDFAPGDEVFGAVMDLEIGRGTIAEYAVASTAVGLTRRPPGLGVAQAGALAIAGTTAHTGLDALALQSGHTVLITGATGGVGSLAVQLARATGARILATHRSPNGAEYLAGMGAHDTVDATGDITTQVRRLAPHGVDAALHLGGDLDPIAVLVKDGGHLATAAAQVAPGAYDDRALTVTQVMADASAKVLDHLAGEVAASRLHVPIARTFTLTDAPEAIHRSTTDKRLDIPRSERCHLVLGLAQYLDTTCCLVGGLKLLPHLTVALTHRHCPRRSGGGRALPRLRTARRNPTIWSRSRERLRDHRTHQRHDHRQWHPGPPPPHLTAQDLVLSQPLTSGNTAATATHNQRQRPKRHLPPRTTIRHSISKPRARQPPQP